MKKIILYVFRRMALEAEKRLQGDQRDLARIVLGACYGVVELYGTKIAFLIAIKIVKEMICQKRNTRKSATSAAPKLE